MSFCGCQGAGLSATAIQAFLTRLDVSLGFNVPSDVSLPNAMLRVASASMHEHSLFFLCWEKHAIVNNLLSVGHCYSASLMPGSIGAV